MILSRSMVKDGQLTISGQFILQKLSGHKWFVFVCLDGPGNLTLTALPEKTVYISGSTFFLSCSADSKPTASFYWMFNGNLLNVNGPSFVFTKATQNLSGVYTCGAQNAVTLRYVAVTKSIRIVGENTLKIWSSKFPSDYAYHFYHQYIFVCLFRSNIRSGSEFNKLPGWKFVF